MPLNHRKKPKLSCPKKKPGKIKRGIFFFLTYKKNPMKAIKKPLNFQIKKKFKQKKFGNKGFPSIAPGQKKNVKIPANGPIANKPQMGPATAKKK